MRGPHCCLLYTSDAADDLLCVDLGGRGIIKKGRHAQGNAWGHLQASEGDEASGRGKGVGEDVLPGKTGRHDLPAGRGPFCLCLLYTSDAADDLLCVDLGGRRIIKKKNNKTNNKTTKHQNNIHKQKKKKKI